MSRDHIIPKFILKGFAIKPEVAPKNQAVLIYDVKRKETKRIKIADAYQLENFNSDITEKHLAYKYENDVAKLFQRIKEIAAAEKEEIVFTNDEYKLLFRFFTIMWRRNDIIIDKAKELVKKFENIFNSISGVPLKERLRPEFVDKSLDDLFDETKEQWLKLFYEHIITNTTNDDSTVKKSIENYKPFIVYNKSSIHFTLHNTYGTLRYIKEANQEISELDMPTLMIEPISSTLCFCLALVKESIDLNKDSYSIKIESWDNEEEIKEFLINGYMTETATSYIVDETNESYIKAKTLN